MHTCTPQLLLIQGQTPRKKSAFRGSGSSVSLLSLSTDLLGMQGEEGSSTQAGLVFAQPVSAENI